MAPRDQILARMYVVLTLLSLLPVLVAAQVLRIYLTDGSELRERGERQASTYVSIPAMRGAITDRAGRTLAVNTARYNLALDPTVRGFADVQNAFFEKLSVLTGQSAGALRRKVERRSSPQYVLLLRGLTEEQKETLETWDVPGLLLDPVFARRYNYGSAAAHVLGHVSSDGRGLAGLEKQYEDYLQGHDGKRAVKRDRRGVVKAFVEGQVVEPRHGETLVLTLDLIRQTIVEEELARGVDAAGASWGTAIAMDPHTGAILAMANMPTYDPNRPGSYPDAARRNRAITDRIEPGSTFKLVSAVAALEQGVVALDDSIDTGDGWTVIYGRTLKDTRAHGRITYADAITVSSNVGIARTAMEMERGAFYQYARNFGFGQPTWIDLPGEIAGRLKRTPEWSGTTLPWMSIGYEVDATPLQVLAAYAALANGGRLVQPYVVAERRDVRGRLLWRARQDSIRRVFDAATARALLPAFERVVSEGTAREAQVDGLRIAGKTGTAQKAAGGSYNTRAYRASFAGFFPADDPQVALVVVLDEPQTSGYGGVVAAPIFGAIARRWLNTLPTVAEQVAPARPLPRAPELPVPDVVGRTALAAARMLTAAGYRVPTPTGEAATHVVTAQDPEAGAFADAGTRVRLETELVVTPVLPDFSGWTARDAAYWLQAHGAEPRLRGAGTVVAQSAEAGTAVPDHVTLTCR